MIRIKCYLLKGKPLYMTLYWVFYLTGTLNILIYEEKIMETIG